MSNKKPKTRCSGTLTDAALRTRIINTLRRLSMYWKPIQEAKRSARSGRIKNPATDKLNMAVICMSCNGHVMERDCKVDHIEPVVPLEGFSPDGSIFLGYNWSEYLERMFCEADGFQVLCEPCHKIKSNNENQERRGGS